MEEKDKKVYDETLYTEIDPNDVYLDYEAVKSTVGNLARGLIRAKRLSDLNKIRKPKLNKKLKKPK